MEFERRLFRLRRGRLPGPVHRNRSARPRQAGASHGNRRVSRPSALAAGTTGADIQVSGSSTVGSPVQGQPYTYTYQVKNSGPQGDQGVVFTDHLTAGKLTGVQALWNGYIPERCSSSPDGNGGTLATCYLGLEKPDFVTVTLNVTASIDTLSGSTRCAGVDPSKQSTTRFAVPNLCELPSTSTLVCVVNVAT